MKIEEINLKELKLKRLVDPRIPDWIHVLNGLGFSWGILDDDDLLYIEIHKSKTDNR